MKATGKRCAEAEMCDSFLTEILMQFSRTATTGWKPLTLHKRKIEIVYVHPHRRGTIFQLHLERMLVAKPWRTKIYKYIKSFQKWKQLQGNERKSSLVNVAESIPNTNSDSDAMEILRTMSITNATSDDNMKCADNDL